MADVEPHRSSRLAEAFAVQPPGPSEMRLCAATAKLLDTAGVGMTLCVSGEPPEDGMQTVCATDGGREGEALQFDLGEGPSYTAHQTGRPVQIPDLECDDTWLAFTEAAEASGLRAVFAFPLRSGSVSIGALTLYQQVAGDLTSEQYADALEASRFALHLLTRVQTKQPPDELDSVFTDSRSNSGQAHQASGVVSVQLEISVSAALAVLRAHAYTEGSSLAEVATQIIEHRLTLSPLPT